MNWPLVIQVASVGIFCFALGRLTAAKGMYWLLVAYAKRYRVTGGVVTFKAREAGLEVMVDDLRVSAPPQDTMSPDKTLLIIAASLISAASAKKATKGFQFSDLGPTQ